MWGEGPLCCHHNRIITNMQIYVFKSFLRHDAKISRYSPKYYKSQFEVSICPLQQHRFGIFKGCKNISMFPRELLSFQSSRNYYAIETIIIFLIPANAKQQGLSPSVLRCTLIWKQIFFQQHHQIESILKNLKASQNTVLEKPTLMDLSVT